MPRSLSLPRAVAACLVVALPVLGLAACDGGDGADPTGPSPTTTSTINPRAAAYLDTALLFTEEVFYYGGRIDWPAVRAKAFKTAGNAQSLAATYPAIDEMIRGLGDPHSFFYEPSESLGNRDDPNTPFYHPMQATVASRVSYLWVPTFGGINSAARADTLQKIIAKGDSTPNLCGWIIDLRGNPGGFWPAMLAGISPLITPGRVGGFVERDTTYRYFYQVTPGVAGLFDRSANRSYTYLDLKQSYQLQHTNLPVAILQGGLTASAGEIIVMAFKEPSRAVRTFGKPTYGVTSQPYTYTMSDKASVQVTAALMFDRQMKTYYTGSSGPIPPDEDVTGPTIGGSYVPGANLTTDAVVNAATTWLNKQPSCGGTGADVEPARSRLTPGAGGFYRATTPVPGSEPASSWPKTRGTPWIAGGWPTPMH